MVKNRVEYQTHPSSPVRDTSGAMGAKAPTPLGLRYLNIFHSCIRNYIIRYAIKGNFVIIILLYTCMMNI